MEHEAPVGAGSPGPETGQGQVGGGTSGLHRTGSKATHRHSSARYSRTVVVVGGGLRSGALRSGWRGPSSLLNV